MRRVFRSGPTIALTMMAGVLVTGCAPNYSPDTYASAAAQQANKVDQGVIVGVRAIQISADTTLATAAGGAAGGVAGSTVGGGTTSALGAVGGSVAGGVVGNVIGHAAGDTDGFEYIVKKGNGELLSVTQKDPAPLAIGAHVLIIEGPQARVVPDYTVPEVVEAVHPEDGKPTTTATAAPSTATPPPPVVQPSVATPPAAPPPAAPPPAAPAVVATPLAPPQPAPVAQPEALPAVGDQKPSAPPDAGAPAAKPDDAAAKPTSGG